MGLRLAIGLLVLSWMSPTSSSKQCPRDPWSRPDHQRQLRAWKEGGPAMNAAEFIAIGVAVLGTGAYLGILAIVSIGIQHEEWLFRQRRRFLQEQDKWLGPDGPDHFLSEEPPGPVSRGARTVTGLYVRRDQGSEPLAIPWYERQV